MARLRLALLLALALVTPAEAQRRPVQQPVQVPMASPPPPLVASVRNGAELWRRGEWAAAVAMWRPFAEAGNADAMFNMGQAHKLGRGVAKDEALARSWYQRAAMAGHRPAQANLGILLFQARELPAALRWLKMGADGGEPRAQYVYGVAHWNGDGVPASLTIAYAYLARAADQGLAEARTALDLLTPRMSVAERTSGWRMARALARADGSSGTLESIPDPSGGTVVAVAPVPQTPSIDPAPLGGGAQPSAARWRVQLGAFSTRGAAEADLAALRSRSPALLEGLEPVYEPGGALVRLQLGSFADADSARAGCARFVAVGRACLVVAP